MTAPDPADLFDATILPDLADTAPEITQALRDVYIAGYRQGVLQTRSSSVAALAASLIPHTARPATAPAAARPAPATPAPAYPPDYLGRSTDPTRPRSREL